MPSKVAILSTTWCLLFTFFTFLWIRVDNKPPAWDQAYYLTGAESLFQTLKSGDIHKFASETTTVYGRKAPLIAYIPLPFYLVFGSSYSLALFANLLFYIPFAVFFYKLIAKFKSKQVALMSLIFVSTMPLFYGLARNYFVEFGLTSIFFTWLYVYFKTEDFSNRKYTLLLGVITGLGMLMKFHFFVLIATPFVYSMWNTHHKIILFFKNVLYLALPVLIVMLPWYSRNIITVLWHAKRATSPDLLGSYYYGNPFNIEALARVTTEIVLYVISPYYLLVFFVLTIVIISKRRKLEIQPSLFIFFLVPFLVFFLGPNKDYRLLLPLLPFIAYFLSVLFALVTNNNIQFSVLVAILPFFIFLHYCFPSNSNKNTDVLVPISFEDNIGEYVEKPKKGNFPNKEIVEYITRSRKIDNPVLISAYEGRYLNVNNLIYMSVKNNLGLNIKTISYTSDQSVVRETVATGDYLIMKNDITTPASSELNINNSYVLELLSTTGWRKMDEEFIFPDGERVKIYEKTAI